MRKVFFVLMSIALIGLAGCGDTKNFPATATANAATQQATAEPTAAPTLEATTEPESIPSETLHQANEIVDGKELISIYDLGNDLFSCPEGCDSVQAFMFGGNDAFIQFQATDPYNSKFVPFDVERIIEGNIQIADSNPAGDFVNVSHNHSWVDNPVDADPMLNGVYVTVKGEQLHIVDTKVSAFDPVSEVIWMPYFPTPGSDDQCIVVSVRIQPDLLYGGTACFFEGQTWADRPDVYRTFDYGTSAVKPVAIRIPYVYNKETRTWDLQP